jgi:hypothetical protein
MRSHMDRDVPSRYAEPAFVEPLPSGFLYAAWSVDPVTVGPFVKRSTPRRRKIDEVSGVAAALTNLAEVEGIRVFEASFMPPLPKMPRYDVVMLLRADSRDSAARLANDAQLRRTSPATVFLAENAARFGATENGQAGDGGATFLLNHFIGPSDRPAAVAVWRQLSAWYVANTGVDNSTLLRTEEPAPFVLVNYVRLRRNVVRFLLAQLLRPSFFSYVRALLNRHQLTSLPLFVREASVGSTGQ